MDTPVTQWNNVSTYGFLIYVSWTRCCQVNKNGRADGNIRLILQYCQLCVTGLSPVALMVPLC